jgi:hypothetical protein
MTTHAAAKTPKTCSRCKGAGTLLPKGIDYAGGTCFKCGGTGWIAGAETKVNQVKTDDSYGTIQLWHRAADHRPEAYTVLAHAVRIGDGFEDSSTEFATLDEARRFANDLYRTATKGA